MLTIQIIYYICVENSFYLSHIFKIEFENFIYIHEQSKNDNNKMK